MPSRKSKASAPKAASSDSRPVNSRWVRCPRQPCLVSFNPRSAPRHASACRYFRCSNQQCNYLGTQRQVGDHESVCPHGLPSEEIGTTDPLSESASEVLDILTSPNRFDSYPTDISSAFGSVSSPRKCPSSKQSQRRQVARSKLSQVSVASQKSMDAAPIPSSSSHKTLHDHGIPRRTLDPYDPSAQRVFSLPLESINPSLRPAPPVLKSSSPAPPPPPTRRLSTYELQRYRPEPQSTQAASSRSTKHPSPDDHPCAAALAHQTALYDALKKCFRSLLVTYDDYIYLVSQKVTQLEIPEEIVGPAIDDFQRAYQSFLGNEVPDLSFLNDLECNAHEECLEDEAPSEGDEDDEAAGLAEENLTADQLSDQVRVKIAELKRRSPPGMDSPGNPFSRKRRRDESALTTQCPSSSSPTSQPPTGFMRKLADTTWELSDEIHGNLPSRCNFKKVIDQAQLKVERRVKSRKSY